MFIRRIVFTVGAVETLGDALRFSRRMQMFSRAVALKRADVVPSMNLSAAGLLTADLRGRDAEWAVWCLIAIVTGPLFRGEWLFTETRIDPAA
jgi:hypothetical protein